MAFETCPCPCLLALCGPSCFFERFKVEDRAVAFVDGSATFRKAHIVDVEQAKFALALHHFELSHLFAKVCGARDILDVFVSTEAGILNDSRDVAVEHFEEVIKSIVGEFCGVFAC